MTELIFRETGYSNGYQEIETPILESADKVYDLTFSDSNVFFKFNLTDFDSSGNSVKQSDVLLRPEGTIPVCRYVARELSEKKNNVLPMSLQYSIVCYRNEPIDTLGEGKRREFNQLGAEKLGDKDKLFADAEVMNYAYSVLRRLGINKEDIRLRVNDITLFKQACETTNLSEELKINFQTLIDDYSKKTAEGNIVNINLPFPKGLTSALQKEWSGFFSQYMSPEKATLADERLLNLYSISELIKDVPVLIDRSVVRGFSYYTGPVFQIDVRKNGVWRAEIGGGGRYDSLIGMYLAYLGIQKEVPATGFAFGTERLTDLINLRKDFKMTVGF